MLKCASCASLLWSVACLPCSLACSPLNEFRNALLLLCVALCHSSLARSPLLFSLSNHYSQRERTPRRSTDPKAAAPPRPGAVTAWRPSWSPPGVRGPAGSVLLPVTGSLAPGRWSFSLAVPLIISHCSGHGNCPSVFDWFARTSHTTDPHSNTHNAPVRRVRNLTWQVQKSELCTVHFRSQPHIFRNF